MAKLPYTYTICPDQEPPKNFTASCKDMGELLRHSPNGDLTINNRMPWWESWTNKPIQAEPFEDRFNKLLKEKNT